MTLLTIAQSVLKETKNSSIPTTIIGNTQDVAMQILEVLKVSMVELARSYDWQELQKERTFSSVASTEGYNLPTDFDRFVNDTFWNTSEMWPVKGPMTPEEWRILKNSTISGGATTEYFRIRQGQTLLFPIPTSSTDSYIYEYITNNIINSSDGSGQTAWLADTDVPVIDEYIVRLDATWRWLEKNGRPYSEEQRTANNAIAERVRVNGARRKVRHNYSNFDVKIGFPQLIVAP
jgi:hypothetical protein